MRAEVVARWQFDREIDQVELFVGGDLSPDASVAGVGPGIVQPGLDSEFAGLRDGVKDPQTFSGVYVVAANVAFDVLVAFRNAAGAMRGADDDDVVGDHGRGVQADVGAQGVDLLVVVFLEIDRAVFAEAGDGDAGFRVERDQAIARGDVEDALFAVAGPVRQAAAGELARGGASAIAFVLEMHPEHFAGRGVERYDIAARSGGGVDDAVDHERRAFV